MCRIISMAMIEVMKARIDGMSSRLVSKNLSMRTMAWVAKMLVYKTSSGFGVLAGR